MVVAVTKPKFGTSESYPRRNCGALRAAREKLFVSSVADVNISHNIAASVPADGSAAIGVRSADWVGIRAKN